MNRPTAVALLVLLLSGSLLQSPAQAVVMTSIDRDYTVEVAGERFGVQDYSGWGWGNSFAGTTLYMGPFGKKSLSVSSRQALGIAAVIAVTVMIAGALAFSRLTRRDQDDMGS